jgi:hypothetical protein
MTATSPQSASPATPARKATLRRRTVGFLIAATTSLLSLGLTGPAFAMMVPPAGQGTPGPAIPLATPTVKVISTGRPLARPARAGPAAGPEPEKATTWARGQRKLRGRSPCWGVWGALAPGASTAGAGDELGGEDEAAVLVLGRGVGFFEQELGGGLAELVLGLAH